VLGRDLFHCLRELPLNPNHFVDVNNMVANSWQEQ